MKMTDGKIRTIFKQERRYIFAALLGLYLLAGQVPITLQAQEVSLGPIHVTACDTSRVDIQLPNIHLLYDRALTNGLLLIFPEEDTTGALGTAFLPESSFHLLKSGILRSVSSRLASDSLVITFTSRTAWAVFSTHLIFYRQTPQLVHWITAVHMLDWHPIRSTDRDVQFYSLTPSSSVQPRVTAFANQDGFAAGLTFLYEANFLNSTVFYFQDFSLSNPYFQWIHASPKNTVGHSGQDLGYALPTSTANLKKGEKYILSSAFLLLQPGKPESETEQITRFLNGLSAIYPHIYKPPLISHDWNTLAQHTLQDLTNPKCWVTLNGQDFLRAYVDIPRLNSAENIAQLDVLVGLYTLETQTGITSPLKSRIESNLLFFYNTEHQQIVNDYPNQGISRGDSWYTMELAIALTRLAQMGSSTARLLLFQSLPSIIQFAHTVQYDFPVFFDYNTFQKISGSEPDVAGGYAYLMLQAYDLQPDSLYLSEAKNALPHISGKGFNLSYELQMTGATAAACARLYRLTNERQYLTLSLLPLANLLRHTWLWECDYGTAKNYSTFFGLSPMPHADVITMKEQVETWQYIREYLSLVQNDLQPSLVHLLQGFVRYTPNVLFYTLPPNLPQAAWWTKTAAYGSTNDNTLMIPYEDLRDGWQKSGQIGQEIYGAGGVLCLVAGLATLVQESKSAVAPRAFVLLRNYPNPFHERTVILVEMSRLSLSSQTEPLQICNVLGQVVRHLSVDSFSAQDSRFLWDGKNDRGHVLPAGIYFAVLRTKHAVGIKKMVFLR